MKPEDVEFVKFWSRVEFSDGCWNWIGGDNGNGYGCFWVNGKVQRAHRIAWILMRGEIPSHLSSHGMCVLHICDNPKCVRPDHLFLGTNLDNVKDRDAKGRGNTIAGIRIAAQRKKTKPFCVNGHALSGENLRIISTSGFRVCRQCARERAKNHYDREKEWKYDRS